MTVSVSLMYCLTVQSVLKLNMAGCDKGAKMLVTYYPNQTIGGHALQELDLYGNNDLTVTGLEQVIIILIKSKSFNNVEC